MTLLYHIEAETKYPTFRKQNFQTYFQQWKCLNSDKNFTEVCSYGFNQQHSSIGSDNRLAPSRPQAIIWTNAG